MTVVTESHGRKSVAWIDRYGKEWMASVYSREEIRAGWREVDRLANAARVNVNHVRLQPGATGVYAAAVHDEETALRLTALYRRYVCNNPHGCRWTGRLWLADANTSHTSRGRVHRIVVDVLGPTAPYDGEPPLFAEEL
jgi:hypothetical protein